MKRILCYILAMLHFFAAVACLLATFSPKGQAHETFYVLVACWLIAFAVFLCWMGREVAKNDINIADPKFWRIGKEPGVLRVVTLEDLIEGRVEVQPNQALKDAALRYLKDLQERQR